MSQINFGTLVDMLTVGTPSSGYIVAYDTDGILKQKDFFGTITEIGGGPTSGTTQSLPSVLSTNNNSGVYSIIMGTSTHISSANGGGRISLDSPGASAVSISTDAGAFNESYLTLSSDSFKLNYKYSTSQTLLQAGTAGEFLINAPESMTLHINSVDFISSNSGTVSTTNTGKPSVIISSRNSSINNSVQNSVIIGGQGLTATNNNTVYVSELNVNNAYTFPTTDGTNGYVLKTDGSGNVTWQADSANATWAQILSTGNTSSTDVIISDGNIIKSPNSFVTTDFVNGTKFLASYNNGTNAQGFIDLNSSDTKIDFRNTSNGQGGYVDITETTMLISHTSSVAAVASTFELGSSLTSNTPLVFKNSSNSNSVTIQSGVTTTSYTVTLPPSQGSSNTFLRNDGSGNLSWATSMASSRLSDVLLVGNTTSTNIVMTTGHSIRSSVVSPYLSELILVGGANSTFVLDNDSSLTKSYVIGDVSEVEVGFNNNRLIVSDSRSELLSTTGSVTAEFISDSIANKITFGIADTAATYSTGVDSVQVLNTRPAIITSNLNDKFPTSISSKGATFAQGVRNSAVIGGSGIVANSSNTVYLANSVNINNAYTLPNTDGTNGYVLKTDGAGNVSWQQDNIGTTPSLSDVLLIGNTTGTSSINIENYISFDAIGITQSIIGLASGSPLSGFQYYVSGDQTSAIYIGAQIKVSNTPGGTNDGTFIVSAVSFSSGITYFKWIGIQTNFGTPYGDISIARAKGYLQLDAASQSRSYTLPNKSGTIALLSDIIESQDIASVLSLGNDTGAYSMVMGTGTTITTSNGGGQLSLDYSTNEVLLSNDGGLFSKSQVYLADSIFEISNYATGSIGYVTSDRIFIGSGNISIPSGNLIYLATSLSDSKIMIGIGPSLSQPDTILISASQGSSNSSLNSDKKGTIISSRSSYFGSSVVNSVILGGANLVGGNSNTVYLGNNVNINNAYTLPSIDGTNGYVLTTDGSGNVTWQSTSGGSVNKETDIRSFTASVVETITHNLNSDEVIVQTYDNTGVQIIPGTIQITGTGSIDITMSSNLTNIKTIIIG